jgi:hypothetical protein
MGDGGVTGRQARMGGGCTAGRTTVLSPLIAAVLPIVYITAGWWYGMAGGAGVAAVPAVVAAIPRVPARAIPGARTPISRLTLVSPLLSIAWSSPAA